MRLAPVAAIFVTILSLAACTSVPQAPLRAPPPDPQSQLPALETRIFALVETERLKTDPAAHTLTLDPELATIARAHSQEMARDHFLGHRAPDGETTATRIMAADQNFQGLLGENIAAQYFTAARGIDPQTYAERFVASWMQSTSHRENLAYPDYTRSGVGAAISGDTVYVTQLFAADLATLQNADGKPSVSPGGTTGSPAPLAAHREGGKSGP